MRRCPSCNSTYTDNTLAFCLTDGTPLLRDTVDSYDPAQTLIASTPQTGNISQPAPTQAYRPDARPANDSPTSQPSTPAWPNPPTPRQWGQTSVQRGANLKVILPVVVGVLVVAGMVIYLLTRSGSSTSSSSAEVANANPTATLNSNSPIVSSSNSSSSTSVTTYSTPTATFVAYTEAIKNKDIEAVRKLLSRDTLKQYDEIAESRHETFDEMMEKGADTAGAPVTRNEKIMGGRATLEYQWGSADAWFEMPFIKEYGQWKLELMSSRRLRNSTDEESNASNNPTSGNKQSSNANTNASSSSSSSSSGAPISGGVLNGKAISLPKPTYPAMAKAAHASGTVTVQVTIDESGKVISAHAVSGHPLLQQAAVQAANQARFNPTTLSGKPVKVTGVLTYNFAPE